MSRTPGSPKTGGRVRGSLDKVKRQLVSEELAYSILATFELLGGTAAMLKWAGENQTIFYTQILSRLMPAAMKEGADIELNQYTQINGVSDFEAARRIAFVLAKGIHQDDIAQLAARVDPAQPNSSLPIHHSPDLPLEARPPRWVDPATLPPSEPQLTQEEVAQLARAKAAADLIGLNPDGKADEHGLARPKTAVETKRYKTGVPKRR